MAVAVAAVLLLAARGYAEATRTPRLVEAALPLPGLAEGTEVRALLIADTHGGLPDMPRGRLERIVAQANRAGADLILLLGDYHTAHAFAWPGRHRLEDSLEPFAKLRAPLGVFAVRGNHDNFWTDRIMGRLGSPVLLVNTHRDVGPLVVAGLDSAAYRPDLAKALAGIPPGRPVLLLAHEPEQFAWMDAPPRPLVMVAGHTHGGQIRPPLLSALLDRLRPYRCLRGICRDRGWTLVVTSGVGTSWVPLRLGVPPEMALLTLYAPSGRKSGTER
ncbi:metallophosphoesterase [Thermaurantiacus tibetensis]|uniref:metallophosphoesterase n=1 Tax=Thermaurantiacus tibetensis TaxID=2759035 RepID=UPI001890429D|nr:metallophosphoesterase [Thermaurantiacus tibetensis]